jgi:hypothetical protein
MTVSDFKGQLYSRQGLWSLFLMCAFPLHLWTIFLALRDFSWLIDRSNLWDAVSVLSYGLVFAFAESVIVFLIAMLLGLLVPKFWGQDRRVTLISILVVSLALWAMISQLYWLLGVSIPEFLFRSLMNVQHPVRFLYGWTFAIVLVTTMLPTYFVLRSDKFFRFIQTLIERFSLLTTFYLIFDFAGLIIVIIRNIKGQ